MYIHELNEWPNFVWDADRLHPLLNAARQLQSELFEDLRNSCFEDVGETLRATASIEMLTQEVVKTSEIEGEKLNEAEVRSSIARKLGLDVGGIRKQVERKTRNIEGIVDVVLDASHEFELPLTADRLCLWHSWLFPTGWGQFGEILVGRWREEPVEVVSNPLSKRKKIHFHGPDALRLPVEMAKFIDWFENRDETDPILRAGIAHLYFVTIHPFEDGNGRIARAIADMALARADKARQRFYSMSAQIKTDSKAYYDCLEATQKGTLDITSWLEWFVNCLIRSMSWAKKALADVIVKATTLRSIGDLRLNDRQKKIMLKFLDGAFGEALNSSKYKNSADCSSDTAVRDLAMLVELGVLSKEGQGKCTRYVLRQTSEQETIVADSCEKQEDHDLFKDMQKSVEVYFEKGPLDRQVLLLKGMLEMRFEDGFYFRKENEVKTIGAQCYPCFTWIHAGDQRTIVFDGKDITPVTVDSTRVDQDGFIHLRLRQSGGSPHVHRRWKSAAEERATIRVVFRDDVYEGITDLAGKNKEDGYTFIQFHGKKIELPPSLIGSF